MVTQQRVDRRGLGPAGNTYLVNFQECELVADEACGVRAYNDGQPIGFGLALKARTKVHAVAKDRVVEARFGAHVPDDAITSVYADTDAQWLNRPAVRVRFTLSFAIKRGQPVQHDKSGCARMLGVIGIGPVAHSRTRRSRHRCICR